MRMPMYTYRCVRVRMCIYTACVCMRVRVCMRTWLYTYACMCACVCESICVYGFGLNAYPCARTFFSQDDDIDGEHIDVDIAIQGAANKVAGGNFRNIHM